MVKNNHRIQYDLQYLNNKIANRLIGLRRFLAVCFLLATIVFAYLAISTFNIWLFVTVLFCGFFSYQLFKSLKQSRLLEKRVNYILNTPLPSQLWLSKELRHQKIDAQQKQLVEAGLQDYFLLHALFPTKPIAMPSQLVDKLWHAFILDTKAYQAYCEQAFGKLFHHIPDYQFSDKAQNIRLFTWQNACRLQGIRPARPHDLPRLFAIDPLIVAGVTIGSTAWFAYQQEFGLQYQAWHAASQTSSSGGISSLNNDGGDYDDRCDIGLTDGGDASCSSSDGGSGDSSSGGDSSCGGGCGGGGGD